MATKVKNWNSGGGSITINPNEGSGNATITVSSTENQGKDREMNIVVTGSGEEINSMYLVKVSQLGLRQGFITSDNYRFCVSNGDEFLVLK